MEFGHELHFDLRTLVETNTNYIVMLVKLIKTPKKSKFLDIKSSKFLLKDYHQISHGEALLLINRVNDREWEGGVCVCLCLMHRAWERVGLNVYRKTFCLIIHLICK